MVTSPPYWSLRDYHVGDAFGRDDTLLDYLASIVADFRKLRRALKADGTVWLNIYCRKTRTERRWVGIELKEEFVRLIERRMDG